jgi:undecaprenyl-diphosphatase
VLTTAITWLPLYISLLVVVIHNNDSFRKVFYVLAGAGLCVLFAGAVDDWFVKPGVARWRPTHDPEIGMMVDVVDGYRGGKYGFFSAHAANTFSIAVFFCWLIRSRLLSTALVIWSLTNCWTRLYLGVHYPGDILVGLTWGFIVGSSVYFLYYRFTRRLSSSSYNFISSNYTSTGFTRSDCDIPVVVLVLTLVYALIKSCIV